MNWLGIIGDALWIVALAMMAGASQRAWRRIPAGTKLPMQFSRDGRPVLRLRRAGIPAALGNFVLPLMLGAAAPGS